MSGSNTLRPLKVLIVEDNRDARTTLRMLLSMAYGYDVYEAGDGTSGIDVALEQRPDVALIDLGLPGMNGFEVAQRMRSEFGRSGIFLVALTGYGGAGERARPPRGARGRRPRGVPAPGPTARAPPRPPAGR